MKLYKICLYDGRPTIFSYKVQRIDDAKYDSLYYFDEDKYIWGSNLDKFDKSTNTVFSLIEDRAQRIFEQNMPFLF